MARKTEDNYKGILSLPGVIGLVVITLDGVAIKSTLDNVETLKYAGLIGPIVEKIRKMVKEINVDEDEIDDDVMFIRLRTKFHEVLIAPDDNFATIVLQRPKTLTSGIAEEEEANESKEVPKPNQAQ